jgi:hypothetical protein
MILIMYFADGYILYAAVISYSSSQSSSNDCAEQASIWQAAG